MLDQLAVDPAKKVNGRLAPGEVTKLLLADAAATGGEPGGARSVWFADWRFE